MPFARARVLSSVADCNALRVSASLQQQNATSWSVDNATKTINRSTRCAYILGGAFPFVHIWMCGPQHANIYEYGWIWLNVWPTTWPSHKNNPPKTKTTPPPKKKNSKVENQISKIKSDLQAQAALTRLSLRISRQARLMYGQASLFAFAWASHLPQSGPYARMTRTNREV